MDAPIKMTMEDLQMLLEEQKRKVAEYITRNLSVYHWWGKEGVDTIKAKEELVNQALNARYPDDFYVLEKYLE
jgi:hypothetical protein